LPSPPHPRLEREREREMGEVTRNTQCASSTTLTRDMMTLQTSVTSAD
jgi:hypothetical protein